MAVQRTFLGYGAALIGTYLVVANASNAGKLLSKGGDASARIIVALQGRGK